MILPQDISPEKSIYVMGGRIIEILNQEPHKSFDPKAIYDKYMQVHPSIRISYNYFLYALDWLFILNAIDILNNANVKKCY